MAWVGGKKALREEVLARFPLYYERYIEVFGGGGWVLFHKPPGTDFEVYNDLNGNLAALYRTVRDHPRELQERLRYVLNSREDFMRLKQVLEHPEGMEEVARAAAFYQVIRYSYAAGCGSFAAPLYGENAADASAFTLIPSAGRGAMLHCFCEVPENWETLELTYQPAFAASQPMTFVVRRGADEVQLGPVPASPAEVGGVVDL